MANYDLMAKDLWAAMCRQKVGESIFWIRQADEMYTPSSEMLRVLKAALPEVMRKWEPLIKGEVNE